MFIETTLWKAEKLPHTNQSTWLARYDIHAASLLFLRDTEEVSTQNAGHAMQEHGSTIFSLPSQRSPMDKVFMKILVPESTNAQEMLKIPSRPFTSRSSTR